jgi:hypothetical protein
MIVIYDRKVNYAHHSKVRCYEARSIKMFRVQATGSGPCLREIRQIEDKLLVEKGDRVLRLSRNIKFLSNFSNIALAQKLYQQSSSAFNGTAHF